MIRFRPSRGSLSASLKEEQIFSSLDELLDHMLEKFLVYTNYIGSNPPVLSDFDVVSLSGDNCFTGYHDECMITFRRVYCVGYCGE